MGAEETLASQLAHVYVLFHFRKAAKFFFDRMLMNFEWLFDVHATLHFSLD